MDPLENRLNSLVRPNQSSVPDSDSSGQEPPQDISNGHHENKPVDLSGLKAPETLSEKEQDSKARACQRVLDLVGKEESQQILKQLPITQAFGRELREFDRRMQTQLDDRGRPVRLQSHKQVGTALFRALHQETLDGAIKIQAATEEITVTAEQVITRLTSQAMRNLESHNIGLPVQKLTSLMPSQERRESTANTVSSNSDHEHAYSMFVLATTLQASAYRPWVLDTLLQSLQDVAACRDKGQIHIGAKSDLYLLGVAVDVKYKNPTLSDKVHQVLGTFLPKEHVDLFIQEYRKYPFEKSDDQT